MTRAAGGAVLLDAGAQLALGDVLEVLIDGQLERRAGGRGRSTRLVSAAGARRSGQHLAFAAADLRVVGRLEPARPGVVEADVAEHVRRSSFFG